MTNLIALRTTQPIGQIFRLTTDRGIVQFFVLPPPAIKHTNTDIDAPNGFAVLLDTLNAGPQLFIGAGPGNNIDTDSKPGIYLVTVLNTGVTVPLIVNPG